MKKKFIAGWLALCLLLSMLPGAAFSADLNVQEYQKIQCHELEDCADGTHSPDCPVYTNTEHDASTDEKMLDTDSQTLDSSADAGSGLEEEATETLSPSMTDGETENPIAKEDALNGVQPTENPEHITPAATFSMVKENEEVVLDGITYTIDFHQDGANRWAYLWEIADPASPTEVTLPNVVAYEGEDYPVTEIKFSRSNQCNNITKLTLPDTLTTVNRSSFNKFPNLTELTIPGSVKNFNGSFQNMKKLETLTFEEGIEELSSNSMVSLCPSLTTITLPSTLKRITAPAAFGGAKALTSIALPEGLVVTEGSLFSGCTSLTSVELPASMTQIPSSTFSGCTKLQSVTAKAAITSIGSSAFSDCQLLTQIPDLSQVTNLESYAFNECGSLPGPVDLSNVTKMGTKAFYNCKKLTGALDLSKLDVIPEYAFSYVSGISSIKFSKNLTSIGKWAFVWAKVHELAFPESLKSIGAYAFFSSSTLSGTVKIPDSVTSIGNGAFAHTSVERFEIGSGVESLNADVFADNASLSEIVIDNKQDNVKILGDLPDSVTVTYTQQSIDDSVGDTISDAQDAPTLQDAVNAAAQNKNIVVKLEKHIKLKQAVTVPAGETVKITAEIPVQIAGTTMSSDLKNLFVIEEGGSLLITGNVTLSGSYNSGSIVLNHGAFELGDNAVVTGSKIIDDYANGTREAGLGVIDSRGENAVFTLSGGKITRNALSSNSVSYSGIVRASEGASVVITGGEISHNSASAADALNCSSGLLLYGNAHGTMSGGSISNNTGHRGSAVMLWGNDDAHRTTFVLKSPEGDESDEDSTITGNTCSSAGRVSGSGAVHVENNSTFTMTGGTISDNKGVQGAGVCVVDGNLQQKQNEYKTAFVMENGTISGNSGNTGGGIYSYSNGVDLKGGKITGNTASNMGGGVYSEGNDKVYSTLHLSNALITDNTARQGGGMWFCATGKVTAYVTEGAAIFENTAKDSDYGKGAGDDFVFSAWEQNADPDYPATLPNRLLGGGAVRWYRDGAVYLPGTNIYPTTSDTVPRYGMKGANTDPITVTNSKKCLALKAVPLSKEVEDVARGNASLIISGNTADKGGGIGSNGGILIGREAKTSVSVTKVWSGDSASDRPDAVTVNLVSNGRVLDTAELTAQSGWKYTFSDLPALDKYSYSVSEVPVPGYTTQITGDQKTGFTITNTKSNTPDGENRYTSLTVQKVWLLDDGGKATDSIQVKLLRNGQQHEIVELNQRNEWKYTWNRLDNQYSWSIVEINVPEGFVSTVSQNGDIWTIKNDDTPGKVESADPGKPDDPGKPVSPDIPADPAQPNLPQTGQLWWPVWLLSAGGIALVVFGILKKKKYHRKHKA